MKKSILWLDLVLICAILVGDFCYMEIGGGTTLKGITSAGFVLLGAINSIYAVRINRAGLKYSLLLITGLFFSMLGDILINVNFIIGALIFAVGHIFYFAAFCAHKKFRRFDLIPTALLMLLATGILTLTPILEFDPFILQIVCIFYGLIISFMVGKAISIFIKERSVMNTILLVGGILFYFSDVMLVFDAFADTPSFVARLCMYTYYPAQSLLALSVYFTTKKEKKNHEY